MDVIMDAARQVSEAEELFTQLVVICDGRDKKVVSQAIVALLRKNDLELVNASSLKTLRKQAELFRLVAEQIGGSLTSLVNELDDMQDAVQSRAEVFKKLHDKIMAGLAVTEETK